MKFIVKYRRYFSEGSAEVDSLGQIEEMVDSGECYVYAVVLPDGTEFPALDIFGGRGPHSLVPRIKNHLGVQS